MSDLYETDVYTWALTQADALRRRSANEIDWENVAEEIESLGKSQSSELYSRYVVLLTHLLADPAGPQEPLLAEHNPRAALGAGAPSLVQSRAQVEAGRGVR